MFRRSTRAFIVSMTVIFVGISFASAVTIETVPVGNPGNIADTRYASPGYGSVNYLYNIGKYEVTAGQYTEFLNAVAKTDTYGLYDKNMNAAVGTMACNIQRSGTQGNYTYSIAPDWANRPVNYVSWGDAARFVNWLTNGQPTGLQGLDTTEDGSYYLNGAVTDNVLRAVTRKVDAKWAIPSEDEWYKAAYHKNDGVTGNYFDYPTRSDNVPSNVLDPNGINNANYYGYKGVGIDGYTIDAPYYRTEVGEFANSVSPYGTYDQGGNIFEWNETVIDGLYRNLRGGSFEAYDYRLHASDNVFRAEPTSRYYDKGFRVAYVPEPGAMGLLAAGLMFMLRRRNRHYF